MKIRSSQRKMLLGVIAFLMIADLLILVWAITGLVDLLEVETIAAQPLEATPQVLPTRVIRTATSTPAATLTLPPKPAVTSTPPSPTRLSRPEPGKFSVYRVQLGETLGHIALKFDVSVQDLVLFNNIANPDRITAGQELVIPGEGLPAPTRAAVVRATAAPTRIPQSPVPPAPGQVNGVPVEQVILVPSSVQQNIRKIYAQGQSLGNNPRAFSKIGDSNMENPHFLTLFDGGPYNLGAYAYLEPVVNQFAGSFGRQSLAVRTGFHSWSVLDADLADKSRCFPGETPLLCELRLHKPSLALIRLGTNDAGYPEMLNAKLQAIVQSCVQRGVIPILGTKADRAEGEDNTNNIIIRQVAMQNQIPLWDFDLVAQRMPERGLGSDRIHLTLLLAWDYTLPETFQSGHGADNLTALIALEQVWKQVK